MNNYDSQQYGSGSYGKTEEPISTTPPQLKDWIILGVLVLIVVGILVVLSRK